MAVFALHAAPNEMIDCRYIDSVDLTIANVGEKAFDVLVEMKDASGILYLSLCEVKPGSVHIQTNLLTRFASFDLLVVTNLNQSKATSLTIIAKNQGATVAVFTHDNCERMN
ncbi:hypothetical protein [Paenibacillus sacheonensis]|uniref:Uncharacterized protein n=1 Tax=Paenibacillus sacheonensis TaxID=742054 RepID=A0A7X4YL47_9BACL|nr:hypothetical protein [Paenibacillus sacheonensis]MBM7563078.1 hypothetical protein [Paenibacillus sacheonensis]NBC68353.1 hypothetical protein [Paenibacillus sacheonensis]